MKQRHVLPHLQNREVGDSKEKEDVVQSPSSLIVRVSGFRRCVRYSGVRYSKR